MARLAGALRGRGIPYTLVDANLEGLLDLMKRPQKASDTWTRRALKNLSRNLSSLRDRRSYCVPDRYKRAVLDIHRVLDRSSRHAGVSVALADYRDRKLSPVQSTDLLRAAERPERNPFFPYFSLRFGELLEKSPSSPVVGLSLNYLSQALCTFSMIGFLRREFPEMPLVLGGGLVTSWVRRPGWRNPFAGLIDHLVAGPGEGPLLELLGQDPSQEHPAPPAYTGLPTDNYLAPGFILPYTGSSGCHWRRCAFCPEHFEANPYRPLPAKRAVSELARLVAETGPALIHLVDNALSPSLLQALVATPPGGPWYGFTRIGPQFADIEFCRALKASGCVLLKVGLESGDQEVLDGMHKGLSLESVSTGLTNLARAGIAAYVYLLFGTPPENLESARRTLAFVVRHRESIRFLNLAVFNLPVGAGDAENLQTHRFYAGDLSLYTDFTHPEGWGRRQVRRFVNGEFRKHPAVAPILRRHPPYFTSNHAPFFTMNGVGTNAR